MKIKLSKSDLTLLKDQGIIIDSRRDIFEDDALKILDAVYDVETFFANSNEKADLRFASIYAKIADRISIQM